MTILHLKVIEIDNWLYLPEKFAFRSLSIEYVSYNYKIQNILNMHELL